LDGYERRLVLSWLALVAITLASFAWAEGASWLRGPVVAATVVVVLAFIKVRIVILDFMEVRTAPPALRLLLEVWVVAACGAIVAVVALAN
jgi:heme/copper-type cytochrome/quinol oxidase subunit 4